MTDPIADMLTRIRNAQMARKPEVILPYSRIKMAIAEIIHHHGYFIDVGKSEAQFPEIRIKLKYINNQPAISSIKRISKVGRRIYLPKDKLPVVLNGLGLAVVSTSKGLVTAQEARKLGLGGEVICEVY